MLRAFARDRARSRPTRCSSWRRATPSASTRSSASRGSAGFRDRAAIRAADRRRAARRRRRARHDRRAGAGLPGRRRSCSSAAASSTTGGHNILEPAVFGKPIVFGPHMQNFAEIAEAFLANDAAVQVQSGRELEDALVDCCRDPVRRARLGAAARALVEANRGARERSARRHRRPAAAGRCGGGHRPALPPWPVEADEHAGIHLRAPRHRRGAAYHRRPRRDSGGSRGRSSASAISRVGGTRQDAGRRRMSRACCCETGERPAILSRGYARRSAPDGVVVVSRRTPALRRSRTASGDEPLMLARAVPGAPVLVSPDRYLAGRLAERHLGATVHVLDDGFQHLPLARDIDLLLVGVEDVADARTLPAGRLREPLAAASFAARRARAVGHDEQVRRRWPRASAWRRRSGWCACRARRGASTCTARAHRRRPTTAVLAVAGIARPERFFEDLRARGWDVRRDGVVPGPPSLQPRRGRRPRGVGEVGRRPRRRDHREGPGPAASLRPLPLPVLWVPLEVRIEPAPAFRDWLAGRLAAERARGREVPA